MCLYTNVEKTNELRHSGKKFVSYYKVVKVMYYNGRLRLVSPMNDLHEWKPGWNVSDRAKGMYPTCDMERIERGIHVYTKIGYAEDSWMMMRYAAEVLTVQCLISDLVAVGKDDGFKIWNYTDQAVFERVYVKQRDYAECLKSIERRRNGD